MLAFFLKFAALNLFRNRTQTVISLLAICSSITILLFFRGFIDFTLQGLQASTIAELGHVQIAKSEHFAIGGDIVNSTDNQLSEADVEHIKQSLANMDAVKAVSPRLQGSGIIAFNDTTLYVKLTGVDPQQDTEFASAEMLIDGRQIRNDNECVLGNALYEALHIDLMQEVSILSTTEDGGMNAITCQLVGVVETKSRELDKVYTKLHIHHLQTLFDTQRLNYIMVLLENNRQLDTFVQELSPQFNGPISYRTWQALAEYYQAVKSLYESVFNIAIISLILIMTLSILNTVSMSIFDRHSEIGMLRAIGTSKQQIFIQFFIEGALLGVLGAVLGTLVGISLISYLNYLGGISMPPAPGMTSGYSVIITVSVLSIGLAFLLAVFSATLATIYPSYIATKKDIVSSINKV